MYTAVLHINKPNLNTDSQAKTMLVDSARDVYYENTGEGHYAIRRRPGRTLFANLGQPEERISGILRTGQGVFWSDRFNAVFAVSGGKAFRIEQDGSFAELAGEAITKGRYVSFAEAQKLDLTPFIYIAHGGRLVYMDGTSVIAPTDENTPSASAVTSMNNRIWADNGGQDVCITDTNPDTTCFDPFYWSFTGNPLRAAQKPDIVLALHSAWNEVSMWGTDSIEYWQEDGVNPVSPLVGATSEVGILAPQTLKMTNNMLFALCAMGGKRAVVKMVNRAPQIISDDIDRELQKLDTVSDATSSLVFCGGVNALVMDFPTEKKSFAYDLKENIWTEWGSWQPGFSRYDSFSSAGSCYAKAWNRHLVIGHDGNVYSMSRDVYDDMGSELRSLVRTGWINHGVANRKRQAALNLKVKSYSPTPCTMLMRWRNDGRPEWSSFMEIPLGSESEQTQWIKLNRGGIYHSRQYEFVMTDNADLAFMGMTEDYDILRG